MQTHMAETLGQRIKRMRTERKLGLRQTARNVGISAAYLSRVENGKEPAIPAEETLRRIAQVIGDDFDELMHLAGRITNEVRDVVKADPGMPEFLRRARDQNISADRLMELLEKAGKPER